MDMEILKQLVKLNVGVSMNAKDPLFEMRINGVLIELEEHKGISITNADACLQEFIVDYATWRYNNVNSAEDDMPRHLKFRMNNIIIHNGGDKDV